MTEAELKEIEERCNKATKGPWTTKPTGETRTGFALDVLIAATAPGKSNQIYAKPPGGRFPAADQDFIAAARTDVPDLIAEVRRLREALTKFPMALSRYRTEVGFDHDPDCPGDDTCDCAVMALNDAWATAEAIRKEK